MKSTHLRAFVATQVWHDYPSLGVADAARTSKSFCHTEDARLADQSNDTPSRDGDVYDKLFERILANEGDLATRDESARPSQFTPLLCSNCFAAMASASMRILSE